jgi:hypothetical protein
VGHTLFEKLTVDFKEHQKDMQRQYIQLEIVKSREISLDPGVSDKSLTHIPKHTADYEGQRKTQ